jgi:beta-glucanase (GH16 family)
MRGLFLFALLATTPASPQSPTPNPAPWKLAWSDEFNGPANAPPDPAKWVHDLGHNTDGWGNHELESYTDSIENAHQDGQGHLVIRALKDAAGNYTSARLKTLGKYATLYGKIEARVKIPHGQGVWPAFWSMGADIEKVEWPNCGEIDIMENIGKEPNIQHGSLHGPGYSDGHSLTGAYTLPKGQKLSDDFHVYGITWTAQSIQFEFDGHQYFTATPASIPAGSKWIFNKPFFLLLNLAIGGDWPGPPNNSTMFPQEMLVDYVRVYKPATSQ